MPTNKLTSIKPLIIITIIVGILAIGGWVYAYSQTTSSKPQSTPLPQTSLKVSATIYPLYDLVRQVGGQHISVELIVPPGSSPHTFAPTPEDITRLNQSQAIFTIGHNFDDWVTILAQEADIEHIIPLDNNIDLIKNTDSRANEHELEDEEHLEDQDHQHGTVDPHYWLSLINAQIIVQTIADQLSQLDPSNQNQYQQNASKYIASLDDLYQQSLTWQQSHPISSIATFHNAWQYLARDYNFSIAANFEPFAGQEPTAQEISHFSQTIKDHQIDTIFTEPQFSSQKIHSIAQDLNVTLSQLDPLGGNLSRDTYLSLMQYNLEQIFKPHQP